jgi:hypothetical protein
MMAWIYLVLAGLLEIGWAISRASRIAPRSARLASVSTAPVVWVLRPCRMGHVYIGVFCPIGPTNWK